MTTRQKIVIGWQEWVSLPDLEIPWIKAKIDTGAATSCLHAINIKELANQFCEFLVHPIQNNKTINITCRAKIIDKRIVKSSTGHKQSRYVIETKLHLGEKPKSIQITLSDRKDMMFRMLLGRQALSTWQIDSSKKCLLHQLTQDQQMAFFQ
jgi:ribosomal protein S6--L-glutamate ligase